MPTRSLPLLAAICLDAACGDPPSAAHPVAWLGRLVRLIEAGAPRPVEGAVWRRRYGVAAATALPLALALGVGRLGRARGVPGLLAEAVALDLTTALRALLARADQVRSALDRGAVAEARALLATHLVSRATADLAPSEVAGAAIESVAENLSDGVIAPWVAYAVAGLPGAVAYRAINTLDAMWGYRTPPYADLGFGAARLDDLANLVPARVTAAAICVAAATAGADAAGALRTWGRDAGTTVSPNAGHPMAAMAGALGVTLMKRDAYRLNAAGREPTAHDVARAIRLARHAAAIAAAALLLTLLTIEDRA